MWQIILASLLGFVTIQGVFIALTAKVLHMMLDNYVTNDNAKRELTPKDAYELHRQQCNCSFNDIKENFKEIRFDIKQLFKAIDEYNTTITRLLLERK